MKTSSVGKSASFDNELVETEFNAARYVTQKYVTQKNVIRCRDVASYISTEAIKSEFDNPTIRKSAHSTGCCASIDASRGKPGRSGWFTKIYFPALSDSR